VAVRVLSARHTRVLLAVIDVWERAGRCTVREVTEAAGYTSTGTVHPTLVALAAMGLVAWQPNTRGTLRPLVQLRGTCAA
jgi:DNA-binding IclR family transcriptional regulator